MMSTQNKYIIFNIIIDLKNLCQTTSARIILSEYKHEFIIVFYKTVTGRLLKYFFIFSFLRTKLYIFCNLG